MTLPLSAPAAVGENTTPNVRLCPAVSVTGVPAPLRVKPVPVSVMLEIVTLEFPVFVTVTFCVEEEPAFTFPNVRLVELNDRVWEAATPVPLKAIVAGELGALLTIDTVPLAVPAEAGEKLILKLVD